MNIPSGGQATFTYYSVAGVGIWYGIQTLGAFSANSNIAAQQTTTSTTYTTLSTPDQVSVYLPANGYINVSFQAMWQESISTAGRAALFIDGNQLVVQGYNGTTRGPLTQAAATGGDTSTGYVPLWSGPTGLFSTTEVSGWGADVTTGQAVGFGGNDVDTVYYQELGGVTYNGLQTGPAPSGACQIFAAAGTHTISVRYKTSSGTLGAKNRKLGVWVQSVD
jgi:hypothetical protein